MVAIIQRLPGIRSEPPYIEIPGKTGEVFRFEKMKKSAFSQGGTKTAKLAKVLEIPPGQPAVAGDTVVRLVIKKPDAQTRIDFFKGMETIHQLAGVPGIVKHITEAEEVVAKATATGIDIFHKLISIDRRYINGNLWDFLNKSSIPLDKKKQIAFTLLQTLSSMHAKGIYHRDLKEGNILIDENLNAAICDFDSSWKPGDSDEDRTNTCVTPYAFSPEKAFAYLSRLGLKRSEKEMAGDDVWAMGLVLFHLFSNQHLLTVAGIDIFSDEYNVLATKICALQQFVEPKEAKSISHLIWEMLQVDPAKRITAQAAFERMSDIMRSSATPPASPDANNTPSPQTLPEQKSPTPSDKKPELTQEDIDRCCWIAL